MYKPAFAGLMVVLAFVGASLACSEWIPEYTPPAPQQTSGALNSTYEAGTETARATATATRHLQNASTDVAGTLSVTPAPTDTPTATFTPSIFEVSPCPTGEICEVTP